MFFRLMKTIILLGQDGNPAQKALQVTQLVIYPAFVIMCLVILHIVTELYLKIIGSNSVNDNYIHIESVTRIVIDSLVYTGSVAIWGHIYTRYKDKSLVFFNYMVCVSSGLYQNQFSIVCIETSTLLTIFSLYFNVKFYIISSTVLLIYNLIRIRLFQDCSKHTKPLKTLNGYWGSLARESLSKETKIRKMKITKNILSDQNTLVVLCRSGNEITLPDKDILINTSDNLDNDWDNIKTQYIIRSKVYCEEVGDSDDITEYILYTFNNQYVFVPYIN